MTMFYGAIRNAGKENEEFYDIEIPTLEEHPGDEEFSRVMNLEDMKLYVSAMGFDGIEDFNKSCSIPAEQLVGKWFLVMGTARGRFEKQPVFIKED